MTTPEVLVREAVVHIQNLLVYPPNDYPDVVDAYKFLATVAKAYPDVEISDTWKPTIELYTVE